MASTPALDYLAGSETVHIATELRDGGEVVTPIWAVVADGVPYIRNGYGSRSKWYRRLQRTRRAVFVDGPNRYPVEVENLDDEATNRTVDDAYHAKYARYAGPLRLINARDARAHTMRITPR
jgi:hypothetical protein